MQTHFEVEEVNLMNSYSTFESEKKNTKCNVQNNRSDKIPAFIKQILTLNVTILKLEDLKEIGASIYLSTADSQTATNRKSRAENDEVKP